jgi:hypothetical protein
MVTSNSLEKGENVATTAGSKPAVKSVHSNTSSECNDQVEALRLYLGATLASVGCPREAIKSYVGTTIRRISREGFGFVKKSRQLFIQGVRVIARDYPLSFSNFRMKGDFPRYLNWVFSELQRQSESDPSETDYRKIKALLEVLNWPKAIFLKPNRRTRRSSLVDFVDRVKHPGGIPTQGLGKVVELNQIFFEDFLSHAKIQQILDEFPNGSIFDPQERSQKPCSIWKGKEHIVPALVQQCAYMRTEEQARGSVPDQAAFASIARYEYSAQEGMIVQVGGEPDLPMGEISLRPEKGGKIRVIANSNGWLNAFDLRKRVVRLLAQVPQDASQDQSRGHSKARLLSMGFNRRLEPFVPLESNPLHFKWSEVTVGRLFLKRKKLVKSIQPPDLALVSADLSAFTDNILPATTTAALQALRCHNLIPVVFESSYQLPNSKDRIFSKAPLMGFKGCFDLASFIHHAIVQEYVTRTYAMCGDDLVGIFDLQAYETIAQGCGLKLNRSKTVVSKHYDTAVFCGKVYFRGIDVSPMVPPLHSMFTSRHHWIRLDAIKSACDRLSKYYPAQRSAVKRIIRQALSHLPFFVSTSLPTKLGGVPIRPSSGSLDTLLSENLREHLVASNAIPFEQEVKETTSRNLFPGLDVPTKPVAGYTPNLVQGGAVTLPKKKKRDQSEPPGKLKDRIVGIDLITDYYYCDSKLPSVDRLRYLCSQMKSRIPGVNVEIYPSMKAASLYHFIIDLKFANGLCERKFEISDRDSFKAFSYYVSQTFFGEDHIDEVDESTR